VIPKAVKEEVLAGLSDSGIEFDAAADLCELAARRDPLLRELAAQEGAKIAACFPRAVRCLFSAAGAPLRADGVAILNMRTEAAGKILTAILGEVPTGREAL
jgi:hypothetical protein